MIRWWVDDAVEMITQLSLLQEAPHETYADQQKDGPVMALVDWEWHAQELM